MDTISSMVLLGDAAVIDGSIGLPLMLLGWKARALASCYSLGVIHRVRQEDTDLSVPITDGLHIAAKALGSRRLSHETRQTEVWWD